MTISLADEVAMKISFELLESRDDGRILDRMVSGLPVLVSAHRAPNSANVTLTVSDLKRGDVCTYDVETDASEAEFASAVQEELNRYLRGPHSE